MQFLEKMISDYLEAGFLENIIDMLKHDTSLFYLLAHFIKDGRQRVRIGALAIVESLLPYYKDEIARQVPSISKTLLEDPDPVKRADAAYLLSIIGDGSAVPFLKKALLDSHLQVYEAAREAIEEIGQEGKGGGQFPPLI